MPHHTVSACATHDCGLQWLLEVLADRAILHGSGRGAPARQPEAWPILEVQDSIAARARQGL